MMSSLHRASKFRRAFAVLEYVMVIIILAAGLYTFRSYIQRGFQGGYRRAGESFAFTRQYNPGASRDCVVDGTVSYEKGCFNNKLTALGCARQEPAEYDTCIKKAQALCKTGCDF